MKKALGLLAVVGGAAALIAYKVLKDEKVKVVNQEKDVEKHIIEIDDEATEEEEEDEAPASYSTASYPNLDSADMIHLNDVSEAVFETIDFENVGEEDRPIQHKLSFENRLLMEKFKSVVIEEGYVVTSGETDMDLVVLHISKVDTDLILSKVFYLANLAKECSGTYTGWILK